MRTQKKVGDLLRMALEVELDCFLSEEGFVRHQNSLEYVRKIKDGAQTLRVHFDVNPTYEPNAIAHLLPQLVVRLDEVNNLVRDMFRGDLSLIGTTEITFVQQLQNAAPRQERFVNWFVFDRETANQCCGFH